MPVGFPNGHSFRVCAYESLVTYTAILYPLTHLPAQVSAYSYFFSTSVQPQPSLSSLNLPRLHEFIHLLNLHSSFHHPSTQVSIQCSFTIEAFWFCFCLCVCARAEVSGHDQSQMVILTFLFVRDRVSCFSLLSLSGQPA